METTTQNVTNEQLADFGFPVQVTDKVCGSRVVVVAGSRRAVAVHKAWVAGFVTWGKSPAAPVGTWAEQHGARRPTPCPQVVAWVRSQQRVAA